MQYSSFAFLALVSTALAIPFNQSPNPNNLMERAADGGPLGINCRGSSECGEAGFSLSYLHTLVNVQLDMNRKYINGQHIACIPGTGGTNGDQDGLCVFPQNLGGAGYIQGQQIKDLLAALMAHGCKICGSVPTDWPVDNNPNNGILTVNYVENSGGCKDIC